MLFFGVVVSLFALSGAIDNNDTFPEEFLFGFATASYQIEGGWNADGKGENVWDRFTHEHPEMIVNGDTGDIADDSYHKYKEDVQILHGLGAQVYRFSLAWSRILPTGDVDVINQAGIDYYNNLINELLANGIQPAVTIFHWDLPQPLQDIGGWPNPLLADYFEEYARIAFENFGDRVKWWITFNEPLQTCHDSYGGDGAAPAINRPGIADYLCTHTLLISHARAYHLYDSHYRPAQKGKIGITLNGGWSEPASDSEDDKDAAERKMQWEVGWFAHAIFSEEGDYPPIMREVVDANSKAEGRPRSRLPTFDKATVDSLRGSADFYGLNHYSTTITTRAKEPTAPNPSWERDGNFWSWQDESWPGSASDWLKVVPWGIRKQLNWIKKSYNNIPVFITENGFSDTGELEDANRINYYNSYLHEILNAIKTDGCNVLGYTAWSLLDNFEWRKGYSERFGVYHIDYDDENRKRTPKASAEYFKDIISKRSLPPLESTPRSDQSNQIVENHNDFPNDLSIGSLIFKRRFALRK